MVPKSYYPKEPSRGTGRRPAAGKRPVPLSSEVYSAMARSARCGVCGDVPAPIDRGKPCRVCSRAVASVRASEAARGGLASDSLAALVVYLHQRGDGWVRIVPAVTGQTHYKWRFTSGRWLGRYVYWCEGQKDAAGSGFAGLVEKLAQVDAGTLIPSKDIYVD